MKKAFFLAILALFYAFLLDGALKPVKALESDLVESESEAEEIVETYAINETWHNIGTSLPHPVDYSNSDLVNYVKRGDIYAEMEEIGYGSVAIVEGVFYDETYDQLYVRLIEVSETYGVSRGLLTPTRFKKSYGAVYRMTGATKGQIEFATLFCESQLGKSARPMGSKDPTKDKDSWYSAELLWAAFYWHGLELDRDDNEPDGSIVYPVNIVSNSYSKVVIHNSRKTTSEVYSHYSHKISCIKDVIIDEHIFRRHMGGNTYQCITCGYTAEISEDKNDVFLNCHTEKKEFVKYCEEGTYILFTLNVECEKSFQIESTLLGKTKMPIQMRLYDADMELIDDSPTLSNKNLTATFTRFLGVGKYYLRVNYGSYLNGGDINVTFTPTWGSYSMPLSTNYSTDMTYHLHPSDIGISESTAVFHNEDGGAGYYKISLDATRLDGMPVNYSAGTIVVKDASNINNIYKYNLSEEKYLEAINSDGVNSLYVYFNGNGYFYVHVNLENAEYASAALSISKAEGSHEIVLKDKMLESFNDALFIENQVGDFAQAFTIDRLGCFDIVFTATSVANSTIECVVIKEIYDEERYTYTTTMQGSIILNNAEGTVMSGLALSEGKYYLCYFDNKYGATITADLRRKCNVVENQNYLLVDPGSGYECGSEVRFNNGAYNNKTITEGFTRMIYINPDVANYGTSRLKYQFYSSKPVFATVSIYGTILAKSVQSDQEVTIYAVSKESPNVVAKINITVKKDTRTEDLHIYSNVKREYSYAETDGIFQFVLKDADCPYPRFQDYLWNLQVVEGDATARISLFGQVVASGPCTLELIGLYITNTKVYVHITIQIE